MRTRELEVAHEWFCVHSSILKPGSVHKRRCGAVRKQAVETLREPGAESPLGKASVYESEHSRKHFVIRPKYPAGAILLENELRFSKDKACNHMKSCVRYSSSAAPSRQPRNSACHCRCFTNGLGRRTHPPGVAALIRWTGSKPCCAAPMIRAWCSGSAKKPADSLS